MDWWLIALLAGGGILLVLRMWLGPADVEPGCSEQSGEPDDSWRNEPEPWEAEALARYGTETSVDQLIAQGRTDELRGLGYKGDLPDG